MYGKWIPSNILIFKQIFLFPFQEIIKFLRKRCNYSRWGVCVCVCVWGGGGVTSYMWHSRAEGANFLYVA